MSLNIGFNGTVYDENGIAIDCKYQVHYVTQNVWNNVRDTDTQYYSANAGDGDSLTQDGALNVGDVILIAFWQGDGNNGATPTTRTGIFDRFGVISIVHDGRPTYTIDVQLKPKEAPTASWVLNNIRTINRDVVATDSSYDWMTWDYNTVSMFHRQTWYGVTIFDSVDVLSVEYDWTDDNDSVAGFEPNNIHQYTAIGDYTPTIHVTNAWGLDVFNSISIRIKYNSPIGDSIFSPDGVTTLIHTTEDDTITANISDEDNRITSIDHKWIVRDRNTSAEISNELVATNIDKAFAYTKTIQVLQKHFSQQIISWNDGYDDLVITYEEELPITNWLPLVNFSIVNISDKILRFVPNCSDIDGTVVNYEWNLYFLVPFSTNGYTIAKNIVDANGDDQQVDFTSDGHYKMVLTATDDYGGQASFEKEFDVASGSVCDNVTMSNDMFFLIKQIIK